MKIMQAILITAYKNKNNLYNIIKSFRDEMNIYVHIDKKSEEINVDDFKKLNFENLTIIKRYYIGWGSYSHILAIIDLMKMAINDEKNTYLHIISGEDYKIKSISYFHDNFENCNKIYCTVMEHEELSEDIKKRYTEGTFNSYFSETNKKVNKINQVYKQIHKNNTIGEFEKIYKGMIWSSMSVPVAKYILDYIDNNPDYLEDLKHCKIPEEFFIQTIIMNSKYKTNVVKKNLRYTVWGRKKYGCNPDYLDETDFEKINNSTCIFMRKIDSKISKKLIKQVDNNFKPKNKLINYLTNKCKKSLGNN